MINRSNYKFATSLLPAIVLVGSSALTLWLWDNARQNARRELAAHFRFNVSEISSRIQQNITIYEQLLRSGKGLFSASETVSREEFRQYADELLLQDRYAGIQGLGFALAIPEPQKEAHIAAVRAQGFPDYTIHPLGKRDLYTSIIYLEPFRDENLRAFGYDMYSELTRRSAMVYARDTGKPAISGKVSLVQYTGDKESIGFLMYLPVYEKNLRTDTLESRRKNLYGWVYAPFRMRSFMAKLEAEYKDTFNIGIYDSQPDPSRLLYSSTATQNQTGLLDNETTLHLPGRNWVVRISPSKAFFQKYHDQRPTIILTTGIGLSILLAGLIWLLAQGRARALQMANRITTNLRESEFRWKYALEGAGDGVWDWNIATGEAIYSKRWKDMLGYGEDEVDGRTVEWERLLHPEDKESAQKTVSDYLEGKIPEYGQEFRMQHKNGSWIWILTRGMVVERDEQGVPLRFIGTHTDISRLKNIESALLQSEERFRFSFETAAIGMALVSNDGHWLKVNRSLCIMLGMTEEELLSKTFQELTHPDDLQRDQELVNRLLAGEIEHYHMQKRYFHQQGHIIWANLSVSVVKDANGVPIHLVLQIEDITERKKHQEEMTHLAFHDALTNLPNRRVIMDRLNHAASRAQRNNHLISVLFIDVDHFKKINDTYGHAFGDEVLLLVSARLKASIRKFDTLGRQGGDEFVIILTEIRSRQDVLTVANKIMQVFEQPVTIKSQAIRIGLSMGIAIYDANLPGNSDNMDELMKKADIALYEAKAAGRNGFSIYSDA